MTELGLPTPFDATAVTLELVYIRCKAPLRKPDEIAPAPNSKSADWPPVRIAITAETTPRTPASTAFSQETFR